jgi:hypothetical protein
MPALMFSTVSDRPVLVEGRQFYLTDLPPVGHRTAGGLRPQKSVKGQCVWRRGIRN